MEQKPCVSVIIPVYNSEKTLKRTLDSVLGQTINNIEVIIIDDGSSDGSREIINNFKKKDSRVKIIFQKNSGVSSARNRGIEIAEGKYIVFVDSDDYIDKNMIKIMYSSAYEDNFDVACCGMIMESVYGNIKILPTNEKLIIKSEYDKFKNIYLFAYIEANRKGFAECWNKMYKMELIKDKNIRFSTRKVYGEDYEFNLKVFTSASSAIILPNALYFYNRINNESSTKKYMNNMLDISIEGYKTKTRYAEIWGIKDKKYINKINWQFFLTIKACVNNEARGNKKLSVMERKNNIDKIKKNSVVKNTINQLIESDMSRIKKFKIYIFKYLSANNLLYISLLRNACMNIIKRSLRLVNK